MCGSLPLALGSFCCQRTFPPITFRPNLGSCGPIYAVGPLTEFWSWGLTSHADFFSTADLSLCSRTVFITRGPLPVACGPFTSPFPSRGPLPPNAHTYTPTHGQPFVVSGTPRTFSDQVRLACRLSTSGHLCFARGPFHDTNGPLSAVSGPFAFQ